MNFGRVCLKRCRAARHRPRSEVFDQACARLLVAEVSFIGFLSFIVSVFVAYPILGRLEVTFARAMPRAANVD